MPKQQVQRGNRDVRAAWRRHRMIARTWLLFLVIFAGLLFLFLSFAQDVAITWTARLTGRMLRMLWIDASVHGADVVSSLSSITIIPECTAVLPGILLVSAVLAYPASSRAKLVGLALGLPALLAINQLRLFSLICVLRWFPDAFEFTHLVVWQSLIIVATLAIWALWTSRVRT